MNCARVIMDAVVNSGSASTARRHADRMASRCSAKYSAKLLSPSRDGSAVCTAEPSEVSRTPDQNPADAWELMSARGYNSVGSRPTNAASVYQRGAILKLLDLAMTRILAATFAVLSGCVTGVFAADADAPRRTYANPVDVDYRDNFEQLNEQSSYPTGADPGLVRHQDEYYLF